MKNELTSGSASLLPVPLLLHQHFMEVKTMGGFLACQRHLQGIFLEICVSLLSQESSQSSSSAWDTDLFCLVKWDHAVLLILPKNGGGGKGTSWWYRYVETTRVRTMGKDACTPITMELTRSGSNCAIRRNSQLGAHTLDLCHLTFFSHQFPVGLIFIWNKPHKLHFIDFRDQLLWTHWITSIQDRPCIS